MSTMSYCKRIGIVFLLAALMSGCSEEGQALLQVGEKAPSFSLELHSGEKIGLDGYSGKGLVMTFMSSWCPCTKESIPFLKEAYQRHENDDIEFLLVGIQDAKSKFEKFVTKWEIPFSTGYDRGEKIARNYGVTAPPTTFFIDKDGIVKRVFYGNIKDKEKEFPQWIKEIL